jgi:hypothetical protein
MLLASPHVSVRHVYKSLSANCSSPRTAAGLRTAILRTFIPLFKFRNEIELKK